MLDNASRRTVLKRIGVAGTAITGVGLGATAFSDQVRGVPGSSISQIIAWNSKRANETDGDSNNVTAATAYFGIYDALSHVGAGEAANNGDTTVEVPDDITTIDELHTFFENWLTNNVSESERSPDSNLLIVREDRFGDLFDKPYHAEYKGNVAVSLGAEAIAWEFDDYNPTRAGSGRGHYWLQQCVAAAGVNYGVVNGHGNVYQDSSVGSGDIATPAAPLDDDNNLCDSSSPVVPEPDTYDTYYWDSCAGQQIRDYFGV